MGDSTTTNPRTDAAPAAATASLNVLVAVDFSTVSFAAIRRACELAGAAGEVRLFHAVDASFPAYGPPLADVAASERFEQEVADRARRLLADRAQDLRNEGLEKVAVDVVIGRPADEILRAAEASRAALVVVGAHAKSAARRVFLGTVSEEVARRSPVPVLVVHEGTAAKKIERVLVAVDHGPASDEAARVATRLGASLRLPVEGIHVIELPVPPAWAGPFPQPLQDLTPELVRELRAAIGDSLTAALDGRPIPIRFVSGSTTSELLRHTQPSDLLVCGTHARGVLGRLAFGSVATHLLRKAPCPVLVVRPRETKV